MCDTFNSARPKRIHEAPTAFPDYIKSDLERATMEQCCPLELAAWRAEMAMHHALPTLEAKVKNRKHFEYSYAELREAYNAATEWTTEDILEHAG
jgi:hypothetical protein